MNYIAWFNGNKFRVPDDANIDTQENQPDSTDIKQEGFTNINNKFSWKPIFTQLRQLFCNKENIGNEYRLLFMNFVVVNLFHFGLFNSSQIKGDHINILIMFGLAEVFGIVFGEHLLKIMSPNKSTSMTTSLVIILFCNVYIKYGGLSEN